MKTLKQYVITSSLVAKLKVRLPVASRTIAISKRDPQGVAPHTNSKNLYQTDFVRWVETTNGSTNPNPRAAVGAAAFGNIADGLNDDLKDSPSLVPYLQEVFAECYAYAREQAADETDLPLETFPVDCPYTPEPVLNSKFLPK